MKLLVIHLLLSCFYAVLAVSVRAQEPAYKNYTTSDGLTSNNVYAVTQDSHGFIWFATDNGVSRFDGTHFKNYTLADGISDNDVLKVSEDAEGRLWFLTFNGKLSFYLNGKIYNQTNCDLLKKINSNFYITSFYQDRKKNIWFGCGNFSIIELFPNGNTRQFKGKFKSMLMWENNSNYIQSLAPGGRFCIKDNALIFCPPNLSCKFGTLVGDDSLLVLNTHDGLYTCGPSGKMKFEYQVPKYKPANALCLLTDSKKNIWIGTLNGADEYEDGVLANDHEHTYLKNYAITYILRDKDNNFWFTSRGNGAFMIPSVKIKLFDEKSGLVDNNISAISVLNDSLLMVGTLNGGVQLIKNNSVIKYKQSLIPPISTIVKIEKYKDGIVWVMAELGLFKYCGGTFKTIMDTLGWNKSLSIASDGIPWIGWGAGLRKVVDNKIIVVYHIPLVNRIFAIEQLDNGEMLLGTDKGLYRYKEGTIIPDNRDNSLLTHSIKSFAVTSDSTLWIGTDAYGLLTLRNNTVTQYLIKDHLLSNHCNYLFADSNKIYVATDAGLNVVSKENNIIHIISYSTENGLVSNHINQIAKKNKDVFVLATDRGVVEFDEKELPRTYSSIPYINSLSVNDSLKSLSSNYNLNYNENNIRIDFGAINFNSAGSSYYRYKLAGADVNWNYTTYTSVKYSYLHPGNYTFVVATQNTDGSWNPQTASFTFYIQTPWWQTWWFKLATGVSLLLIIYLIIRWQIGVYKQKVNRERALAESELKALRAQINPHFIYNSLNAIQDFILQNQKEDANLYLSKFAALMRSILSHSRASSVSLEEEIASLQLYLELEALRFNNNFTFQFIVDSSIDTEYVHIPSMILQPYIENAVLHGLAPLTGGGKITISFSIKNNFLVSTIEDNGIGRKKAAEARKQRVWKGHKSLGMTVTQERIDLMSSHQKEKINMEIIDLVDEHNAATGTRVICRFPLPE